MILSVTVQLVRCADTQRNPGTAWLKSPLQSFKGTFVLKLTSPTLSLNFLNIFAKTA